MLVAGICGLIFGAVAALGSREGDSYAYDRDDIKDKEHPIDPADVDDLAAANDKCNRHDAGRIDGFNGVVDPRFAKDPDYVRGWVNGVDIKNGVVRG